MIQTYFLLKSDLERIYNWCNQNLLTIKCKKAQWMKTNIIDKTPKDINFMLGQTQLEKVSEYRYLGIIVDSKLSFHAGIQKCKQG